MKNICKKLSRILRAVFGWGMLVCLFTGGLVGMGYLAALILGGNTAAVICAFLHDTVLPVLTQSTTRLVLLGLLSMYLSGDTAMTAGRKR